MNDFSWSHLLGTTESPALLQEPLARGWVVADEEGRWVLSSRGAEVIGFAPAANPLKVAA